MRRLVTAISMLLALILCDIALPEAQDPWKGLQFLEGTWEARTTGGSADARSSGRYTFTRELKGHVLARHTTSGEACRGPKDFDCAHDDLLYVYREAADQTLKAIYFDNEGHVIHYQVSVPSPNNAVFVSDSAAGPQFRLLYRLENDLMSGKFQMRMPNQADWTSYLEWSGPKK